MNPLYQQLSRPSNPMLSQLKSFMQTFRGDPRQQVQELLNSGKVTQEQYNAAVRQANELAQYFK